MASISSVTTKVSGFPLIVEGETVVSRVFGKQFSKIQANCGSAICFLVRTIAASTAWLTNFLFEGAGRRSYAEAADAAKSGEEVSAAAHNNPEPCSIWRRVMSLDGCSKFSGLPGEKVYFMLWLVPPQMVD